MVNGADMKWWINEQQAKEEFIVGYMYRHDGPCPAGAVPSPVCRKLGSANFWPSQRTKEPRVSDFTYWIILRGEPIGHVYSSEPVPFPHIWRLKAAKGVYISCNSANFRPH